MHKKISYGGIGTAIAVLLLFLSAYAPSGKIAFLFAASLLSYIIPFETDRKTAVIMWISVSIISFLLLFGASPVIVLSYIICFGNYPVLKIFLDKKGLPFQIVSKLAVYTIYAASVYITVNKLLNLSVPYSMMMLYFIGILVFAAYDYLLKYTGEYFMAILHKK